MKLEIKLQIGDMSENGQVTIVDEDRLCYLVKSVSKGAIGLRTISKALLDEFVIYMKLHPDVPANEVRFKISGQSDIDKYEYGYGATLVVMANMILGNTGIIKSTQTYVTETSSSAIHFNLPHQQIFYGAPGTGKSHTIKETTEKYSSDYIFRTTFHPDSDYSTFVGTYKPTMQELPRYNPQTGDKMGVEKKIVYTYTPQAFLKAYVKAWQEQEKPVFLIIEEINRGNCAQIFGDLFQLLDRENGVSEYPIKADQDMQMHLMEALSGCEGLPEKIKSGEELALPANLYIWATMNTSDQSLFPIDSAFKRRWEWQYMPIAQGCKDGKPIAWRIEADGNEYDWWSFVQKINEQIGTTTSSEDKKLGFFFAKADSTGLISADKFVGKVLFYLWNDVFKDYGLDSGIFVLEGEEGSLTYDKFYTVDTTGKTVVRKDLVEKFLVKLEVEKVNSETFIDEDSTDGISNNNFAKYSLNGSKAMGKSELGYRIMDKYLAEHPEATFEQIKQTFPDALTIGVPNKGLIVELTTDLASYARYYANKQYHSVDGVDFRIFKQWTVRNIDNIIAFAKGQGWSVEEAGNWDRKEL